MEEPWIEVEEVHERIQVAKMVRRPASSILLRLSLQLFSDRLGRNQDGSLVILGTRDWFSSNGRKGMISADQSGNIVQDIQERSRLRNGAQRKLRGRGKRGVRLDVV